MRMRFAPLALAAFMAAIPLASFAQSAPAAAPSASSTEAKEAPGGHRHGHWMKDIQSLTLTVDQKTKIDGYVAASKAANANVTDKQTRHDNMKALRTQIMGVLTPDQQVQLKAKMQTERAAAPKPQ